MEVDVRHRKTFSGARFALSCLLIDECDGCRTQGLGGMIYIFPTEVEIGIDKFSGYQANFYTIPYMFPLGPLSVMTRTLHVFHTQHLIKKHERTQKATFLECFVLWLSYLSSRNSESQKFSQEKK